jgi:hypothetical protein
MVFFIIWSNNFSLLDMAGFSRIYINAQKNLSSTKTKKNIFHEIFLLVEASLFERKIIFNEWENDFISFEDLSLIAH